MNTSERLAQIDQDPETQIAVGRIRDHIKTIVEQLYGIQSEWDKLSGDFWTPETDYPFPLSLEDFTAEVEKWHERIGFELEGGIPADDSATYAEIFPDLPIVEG